MSERRTQPPERRALPRAIKIYGERNTGTNYLAQLLGHNLDVRCLPGGLPRRLQRLFPRSERVRDAWFRFSRHRNLGWKHALPPDADALARADTLLGPVLFVTLTKNPYAWLVSMHRRPYHGPAREGRLEAFLRTPWKPVGRENVAAPFANPIEMWNVKNAAYLALGTDTPVVHCRYEDLVADPLGWLDELCKGVGFSPRRTPFENILAATKGADRGKTFEDYRDHTLHEAWRGALDPDSIRWINANLDPALVRRFGYALLEA